MPVEVEQIINKFISNFRRLCIEAGDLETAAMSDEAIYAMICGMLR